MLINWRVWENEVKRFCFALTLWPPAQFKVSESGIKQQKSMVPIGQGKWKSYKMATATDVYKGRYEQTRLHSL